METESSPNPIDEANSFSGLETNSNLNKKRFPIWLGLLIILGTFILVYFILSILMPKKSETVVKDKTNSVFDVGSQSSTKNSLFSTTYPEIDLTQKIDSDKDGIPDWVEEKIGTDANHAECSEFIKGCADVEEVNNKVDTDNLILILDSSGSMVANIGGETRMEVAKSEILKFVQNYVGLPVNIGLIAYGHIGSNSESDKAVSCEGIETLYELKKVDYSEFESKVNSLQPTGWTPIGSSIYAARDLLLKNSNGVVDTASKNSIIIVTDGEETCAGDPVKAVNDIKAQGFNIKVDLIALGTTDTQNTSLKAIATAGGGEFVAVTDSRKQLNKVFDDLNHVRVQATNNFVCNSTSGTDLFLCDAKVKRELVDFRSTVSQQEDPNLYLYLYQDSYSKTFEWFKGNPLLDLSIPNDPLQGMYGGVFGDFDSYIKGLHKYLDADIDKNREVINQNESKLDEFTN